MLAGDHVGGAFDAAHSIEAERGLTFLHPFDDPAVIAGHGTVGLEIIDDMRRVWAERGALR